jgi:hypothetical protein
MKEGLVADDSRQGAQPLAEQSLQLPNLTQLQGTHEHALNAGALG